MMSAPVSTAAVVECRDVAKTFLEGGLQVDALRGINFRLQAGDRTAIVGTSGSGKSTLLHILGGLAEPSRGRVLVAGQEINTLSQTARGHLRNRALGFVYQFHHLLGEFTALENVAMPLLIRRMPPAQALERAQNILERVGLRARLEHKPGELSGGERQRTAIARAMVTRPQCLMADEPTGNLDRPTAESIHDLMIELNREFGTGLIIVTHDLQLAQKMHRVVRIEDGRIRDE